ncbi:CHAT domain-containing protein [Streptomyces vastus]|uniref:CHAT domain-containing protein n=1 Tax=Streptomyces vastus TaxID=285451 RepID=A0ABN3Q960_9ACTN
MTARDEALRLLRARVSWVRDDDDLSQTLRDEAALEAARLAAETVLSTDLEAATQLGWYHWLRSRALSAAEANGEIVLAAQLFAPVLRADPQADVPSQIAGAFHRSAANQEWSGGGRAATLNTQGVYLVRAYEQTGHLPALLRAVQLLRASVHATEPDDPEHPGRMTNVAAAVRMLAERAKDSPSLTEAVELGRQAAAATPAGHPHHGPVHFNLANALNRLGEKTGDVDLMHEAATCARAVVAATGPTEAELPGRLDLLCSALCLLGVWTRSTDLLEEGVTHGREALRAAPDDHGDKGRFLTNLASGLRQLGEHTDRVELIREAASLGTAAVAATPPRVPYRVPRMIASAAHWRGLAERTHEQQAARKALRTAEDAVAEAANDLVLRQPALSELALCLQISYELTEEKALLEQAVAAARQAAELVVSDDELRLVQLSNLSTVLRHLYTCTGRLAFLEESITHTRTVMESIPFTRPDHVRYASDLSVATRLWAERTDQMEAILTSVYFAREALEAPNPPGEIRALREHHLAESLRVLYLRTRETPLVEESVDLGRRAVGDKPLTRPEHVTYAVQLVNSLLLLHEYERDPALLDEAEAVMRAAVEVPALPPSLRARCLRALAEVLVLRTEKTGDHVYAAEALRLARGTLDLVPVEDARRADALSHVAKTARLVFESSGDPAALAEAHRCFRQAAQSATNRPLQRIADYRAWAALPPLEDSAVGDRPMALEEAVALVPRVMAAGPDPADQQHAAVSLGGLATEAAAAALEAGDPIRAVELLETTRGVLAPVAAETHALELLRTVDDALAEEFAAFCDRLNTLDREAAAEALELYESDSPAGVSVTTQTSRHVIGNGAVGGARIEAYAAWDDFLTRVRALPGMSDFLRPRIAELTAQATEGPVIMMLAHKNQGTALVLTGETQAPVRAVPLPGLGSKETEELVRRFSQARHTAQDRTADLPTRRAAQAELRQILSWLWDTAVELVLLALGLGSAPRDTDEERKPRVWWCPVGLLSFLPLHAAGHHTTGAGADAGAVQAMRTAMDHVVSSYTPTVQALARARALRDARTPKQADKTSEPGEPDVSGSVVIVTEAGGDGRIPALPGAPAEARAVADRAPGALLLDHPEREQVLAALPRYTIAHFVCHGQADWTHPTRTSLLLHDHDSHPMTLDAIRSLRLENAQLAYLSACETAAPHPLLADEALHITAGFHLAGYQQVIGTLWPIGDKAALDITCKFYDAFTHHGTRPPDLTAAAYAVHHAVRAARDRFGPTPTRWAAHIHFGT